MRFIHINKCGGSSIQKALYGSVVHKHETLSTILLREQPKFIFTFIRYPYDRIKSMYQYRKQGQISGISFQNWFYACFRDYEPPYYNNPILFLPCMEWILFNGIVMCDFIGKVENMDKDFDSLCKFRGIQATLPHVNKSKPLETEFTREMKQIVRKRFKIDLEMYE